VILTACLCDIRCIRPQCTDIAVQVRRVQGQLRDMEMQISVCALDRSTNWFVSTHGGEQTAGTRGEPAGAACIVRDFSMQCRE
jgi:hypothetical protein